MNKWTLLLTLSLLSQPVSATITKSGGLTGYVKEIVLPTALPTLPPDQENDVINFNPSWSDSLSGANTTLRQYRPGAIGVLCGDNHSIQDTRAEILMSSRSMDNLDIFAPALAGEDYIAYIKRMIQRVDQLIPSYASHLRQALQAINIRYVNGPLHSQDDLKGKFNVQANCHMVRYSLRVENAYGTDLFINQSYFFHKKMTTPMRAAIVLHDMVATDFKKQIKSDDDVVYSGIVSEIIKNTFNYTSLFEKIQSFGYQVKDTAAFRAVSEYRGKLLKEKSAFIGMNYYRRENEFTQLQTRMIDMAVELKAHLSALQEKQYSDTHLLESFINSPVDGIEDSIIALNNLTDTMTRLFNTHDNEIFYYKSMLGVVSKDSSLTARRQVDSYNTLIKEAEVMKKDQASLNERFQSLKRLTKSFMSDLKIGIEQRLRSVHNTETEHLQASDFMNTEVKAAVVSRRNTIYQDVVNELLIFN